MKIAFRVDASLTIGSGHVMRCLTLASALRKRNVEVSFVSRKHEGHYCDLVEERSFVVSRLPPSMAGTPAHAAWLGASWEEDAEQTRIAIETAGAKPDWLVIDHYSIDHRWERTLRTSVARIMAIDDLADRVHDCDLLLDQNLHEGNPYRKLVLPTTEVLMGPRYALLPDEFRQARAHVATRMGPVRRMVLFFGGSDSTGETIKALAALRRLNLTDIEVDVIVGKANRRKDEVADLCRSLPYARLHCQVANMANILAHADLALGAAGVSSWERLALGVPALVVAVADNQVENMRQLDKLGVAVGLGISPQVSVVGMAQAIDKILSAPAVLKTMSHRALGVVDVKGVDRVAERLTTTEAT